MDSYTLITGGLGFIGSHTTCSFLEKGYNNILILDNLCNSKIEVFDNIKTLHPDKTIVFINTDITCKNDTEEIFRKYNINTVIHMAGLKSVSESFESPLKYYYNNVLGTLNILNLMEKYNCRNFIFSSSATVYGNEQIPFSEETPIGNGITNPYGNSKYLVENILKDIKNLNIIILRYFNPIGAHPSGLLGENPKGIPNNIFPYIMKVARNQINPQFDSVYNKVKIFGSDYNTHDGTGVRDYIDINDLAEAHVASYSKFCINNNTFNLNIFNIGTGKGVSVLELIRTFEKVSNVNIPYEFNQRRDGDLDEVYAKIKSETYEILNWSPKKTLEDSCRNAWNYIK
jgi:UDP-glucose 4-epimerase